MRVFIKAFIILCCINISPAQGEPYTIFSMIEEFLEDEEYKQYKSIDMDIFVSKGSNSSQEVFLNVEIKNDLDYAICIPSRLYSPGSLVAISPILAVKSADGSPLRVKMHPPRIDWPVAQFVVLAPMSIDRIRINLSQYFSFENGDRPFSVTFSFPAFRCSVLEKGYPVTARASERSIGLIDRGPLIVVDSKKDVVVYRGMVSAY